MNETTNTHGQPSNPGDPVDWLPPVRRKAPTIVPITKAASYARYSTLGQRETSIERQVELCEDYIAQSRYVPAPAYVDRARSGAYTVGRDGLDAMLKAAERNEFQVLVIENVDRLARDLAILSGVFKKLRSLGVEMHQPGRGRLHLTDIALQGLLGEEGRAALTQRTGDGRNRMAREGRVPVGAFYGYAAVPGKPGERVIDEAQAEVLRRIFDLRLSGVTPRQIAIVLNREQVPRNVPRPWTNHGVRFMLANPLYAGLLVYRRSRSMKDPLTGRNTIVARPRSEWIATSVPHLRIVRRDVWESVQAVVGAPRAKARAKLMPGRSDYLLASLCRCHSCGGNLMASVKWEPRGGPRVARYICRGNREAGACANSSQVRVELVERAVIQAITAKLLHPDCIDAYIEAYEAEGKRWGEAHAETRAELQRRIAKLDRDLRASFEDGVTRGISNERAARYREEIERKLTEAEADLEAMPMRPPTIGIDRAQMASMRGAIAAMAGEGHFRPNGEADFRLMAAVREIVDHVVVTQGTDLSVNVSVTVRVGPAFGDVASGATDVLTGVVPRHVRGYASSPARRIAEERIAAGDLALSDEDWEAVRPLLPPSLSRLRSRPADANRELIQKIIHHLLVGVPWKFLGWAQEVDRPRHQNFLMLRRKGHWDRIAAVLADRDPGRYAELISRPPSAPRENTTAL